MTFHGDFMEFEAKHIRIRGLEHRFGENRNLMFRVGSCIRTDHFHSKMSSKSHFFAIFAKIQRNVTFVALNHRSESLFWIKDAFAELDSRIGVEITTPNAIIFFRFS